MNQYYRGRVYINYEKRQKIESLCMEYSSVPMSMVDKVLKVDIAKNDYIGIKQNYNQIPPRPQTIMNLASSIARISGQPINKVLPKILANIIDETMDNETMDTGFQTMGNQTMDTGFQTMGTGMNTGSQTMGNQTMEMGNQTMGTGINKNTQYQQFSDTESQTGLSSKDVGIAGGKNVSFGFYEQSPFEKMMYSVNGGAKGVAQTELTKPPDGKNNMNYPSTSAMMYGSPEYLPQRQNATRGARVEKSANTLLGKTKMNPTNFESSYEKVSGSSNTPSGMNTPQNN